MVMYSRLRSMRSVLIYLVMLISFVSVRIIAGDTYYKDNMSSHSQVFPIKASTGDVYNYFAISNDVLSVGDDFLSALSYEGSEIAGDLMKPISEAVTAAGYDSSRYDVVLTEGRSCLSRSIVVEQVRISGAFAKADDDQQRWLLANNALYSEGTHKIDYDDLATSVLLSAAQRVWSSMSDAPYLVIMQNNQLIFAGNLLLTGDSFTAPIAAVHDLWCLEKDCADRRIVFSDNKLTLADTAKLRTNYAGLAAADLTLNLSSGTFANFDILTQNNLLDSQGLVIVKGESGYSAQHRLSMAAAAIQQYTSAGQAVLKDIKLIANNNALLLTEGAISTVDSSETGYPLAGAAVRIFSAAVTELEGGQFAVVGNQLQIRDAALGHIKAGDLQANDGVYNADWAASFPLYGGYIGLETLMHEEKGVDGDMHDVDGKLVSKDVTLSSTDNQLQVVPTSACVSIPLSTSGIFGGLVKLSNGMHYNPLILVDRNKITIDGRDIVGLDEKGDRIATSVAGGAIIINFQDLALNNRHISGAKLALRDNLVILNSGALQGKVMGGYLQVANNDRTAVECDELIVQNNKVVVAGEVDLSHADLYGYLLDSAGFEINRSSISGNSIEIQKNTTVNWLTNFDNLVLTIGDGNRKQAVLTVIGDGYTSAELDLVDKLILQTSAKLTESQYYLVELQNGGRISYSNFNSANVAVEYGSFLTSDWQLVSSDDRQKLYLTQLTPVQSVSNEPIVMLGNNQQSTNSLAGVMTDNSTNGSNVSSSSQATKLMKTMLSVNDAEEDLTASQNRDDDSVTVDQQSDDDRETGGAGGDDVITVVLDGQLNEVEEDVISAGGSAKKPVYHAKASAVTLPMAQLAAALLVADNYELLHQLDYEEAENLAMLTGVRYSSTNYNFNDGRFKLNSETAALALVRQFSNVILMPVFNFGLANSHSVDGARMDGEHEYYGLSLVTRLVPIQNGYPYLTGIAQLGLADTKFRGINHSYYHNKSPYVGLQLTGGYCYKLSDKHALDCYASYGITHLNGRHTTLYDMLDIKEQLTLAAINLQEVKLATKLTSKLNGSATMNLTLAFHHQLHGKVAGNLEGVAIAAPDVCGNAASLAAELKFKPQLSPVVFKIGLTGYVGDRRGVVGMIGGRFEF